MAQRAWFIRPGSSFMLQMRLAFGGLSVLVAAITVVALGGLIALRASAQAAIAETVSSRLASNVAMQALLCRRYEKDFFLNVGNLDAQDAPLQSWHAASIELRKAIKAFEEASTNEGDRAHAAVWREAWALYVRNFGQIEIGINGGEIKTPQEALRAFEPFHANIHTLTDDAVQLAEAKNALARETRLRLEANGYRTAWIVIVIACILIAGPLVAALVFPVWLSRPLKRLSETAQRLAGGDLTARTGMASGDEFGLLGQRLDHMAAEVERSTAALAAQYHQAEEARAQAVEARARAEEASVTLAGQLETIRAQQVMISELSVPLLPLSDWTLMLPLVGVLDSLRIHEAAERALRAIERNHARFLILDITGVPVVDTQVARGMLQIVQAARLLGCTTVLVGTRPEVAQTIVGLGIDLSSMVTLASLQSGIDYTARHSLTDRSATLEEIYL